MTAELGDLAARVWRSIGGSPDTAGVLAASGPRAVLPAYFDVTGLATATVAAATLAAAEYLAAREESRPRPVSTDSRAACAAFAAEGLFTPVGWSRPELWDPVAGNYRAEDGWIRLHTNYRYHRAAVERLLGAGDRAAVQAAASHWKAGDLETAVVGAGGCAAVMHTREAWLASPPGAATATAPPLSVAERPLPAGAAPAVTTGGRPFSGVRVLDLTRVIAGPVCTKFLAAYGADVLRLDPPGFAEVPALLPETTAGKRTATLDLTAAAGRAIFGDLVATADVLVTGLRADALARLGYDDDTLAAMNPALIIASLNAYGWDGPWRDRRGFDSLVQMSCGIAAAGAAAAGRDEPFPLPVQALDHATGYLLAAAVGRALTRRLTRSAASRIRASLAGTASLLWSLPQPGELPPMPGPGDFTLVDTRTAWGPARRVPLPGEIAGVDAGWRTEAGPLGSHPPAWAARLPAAAGEFRPRRPWPSSQIPSVIDNSGGRRSFRGAHGARMEAAMTGGDQQETGGIEVRKRMVVEYGVELDGVWLPLAMLRRLATHGPWDRPFTEATADQERVLVTHSLADRHNRAGLHRGTGLSGFLDAIPFEPTVPFPAVPDDRPKRR